MPSSHGMRGCLRQSRPIQGRTRGPGTSTTPLVAYAGNRPVAGRSTPPTRAPIRYRANAAATSPSTRSMTPPWPGMIVPESFLPCWRLTQDSKRSPACDTIDNMRATIVSSQTCPVPAAMTTTRPAATPRAIPPSAPLLFWPGEIDGAGFGLRPRDRRNRPECPSPRQPRRER